LLLLLPLPLEWRWCSLMVLLLMMMTAMMMTTSRGVACCGRFYKKPDAAPDMRAFACARRGVETGTCIK
jgi:hypothetical protein